MTINLNFHMWFNSIGRPFKRDNKLKPPNLIVWINKQLVAIFPLAALFEAILSLGEDLLWIGIELIVCRH